MAGVKYRNTHCLLGPSCWAGGTSFRKAVVALVVFWLSLLFVQFWAVLATQLVRALTLVCAHRPCCRVLKWSSNWSSRSLAFCTFRRPDAQNGLEIGPDELNSPI